MVDLEAARAWAARVRSTDTASDDVTADYIERLAMELAAHRAASPISAPGPSVAERLLAYRCALLGNPDGSPNFKRIENDAHAMLAAEREPEAVTRG